MNKLSSLLLNKAPEKDIINIYCTAGFPLLNSTESIIRKLETAGADIIELGMPFSDPLADGAVIQQSSSKALSNGMTLEILFDQLEEVKNEIKIPIILMGYLNPIMQFGIEKFIRKSKEVGVSGFIIPDIPPLEFEHGWKDLLNENGLTFSFLVTPETTIERVRYLDSLSSGFLYAVSSSSTTGTEKNDNQHQNEYLTKLKQLDLKNPILAGFGIKSNEDYQQVNEIVNGAIIGSAFIKHLEQLGTSASSITSFIQKIKG